MEEKERAMRMEAAEDTSPVADVLFPLGADIPVVDEPEVEVVVAEEVSKDYPAVPRGERGSGSPTSDARMDLDMHKREMLLMTGQMLRHFRQQVNRRELTFDQELRLFERVSKYLGYGEDGNKTKEDIGMDAFAMKYLDITAKIKTSARKQKPR